MNSKWYRGLSKVKQTELKNLVEKDTVVLGRLKEVLEADLKELEEATFSKTKFDIKAWAEYQAYSLGEIKRLRSVIELITINQANEE